MAPSNSIGVAARSAAFKYRCIHGASSARQYSSRTTFRPHARLQRPPLSSSSQHLYQQSRSISLFGWGSSSQSSSSSTTNVNSPSASTTPDITVTNPPPLQSPSNVLESGRTFKAAHGTADSPASSFEPHKPTSLEPQSIENLQQAIASPHTQLADDSSIKDLSQLSERLGYLKEDCGLDFGWGPSTTMQWIFEHLHVVGGLSWTASIVLLAIAFRCSILPLSISSAREAAKMRELKPFLDPIKAKYNEARAQNDMQKMQQHQTELKLLSQEYNVNIFKAFLPPLIQLPFGFGAWRMLRNAGTLPVPGFVTESWLWTSDLSFSDPYFIVPALSGAIIYATMKLSFNNNAGLANSNFQQLLVKILPGLSFVFMIWQPGAVQLYFLASNCAGYFTTYLMNSGPFRRLVNLPPVPQIQLPTSTNTNVQSQTINVQPSTSTPTTGHMRRRDIITPAPEPISQPTATQNRSWIDKSLDSAKTSWQSNIKTPYKNMMKESFENSGGAKAKEREKTVFERERREARERLRQEEWRKERNEEERRRAAGR